MATPTSFTSDMLRDMLKELEYYRPQQSLLLSSGMRAQIEAAPPPLGDNPIAVGYTQSYMGLPVETFEIPPEEVIDWSGCRSPARAKRRHAQGHPQRIKVTYRERAFLIDRRVLGFDFARRFERGALAAFYGK